MSGKSGLSSERLVVECIGRMPFITRSELSALLGVDAGEAGRVFDALREQSLVEVVPVDVLGRQSQRSGVTSPPPVFGSWGV